MPIEEQLDLQELPVENNAISQEAVPEQTQDLNLGDNLDPAVNTSHDFHGFSSQEQGTAHGNAYGLAESVLPKVLQDPVQPSAGSARPTTSL